MTTDGYADQFGGEKGKKFMVKRLHQLLIDLNDKKMDEQRMLVKKYNRRLARESGTSR
jgi:hypothetical protein